LTKNILCGNSQFLRLHLLDRHKTILPQIAVHLTVYVDVPTGAYVPVMEALMQRMGNLSLSQAARVAGKSKSRFSHDFGRVFGQNFRTVRLQVRLHLAAVLLTRTPMRISEVAGTLEYSSLVAFERTFKQQYEMSPTDYRKSKKASQVLSFGNSRHNT